LEPEPTQHNSLKNWTNFRQYGQTPDKEVDIKTITIYVSGYIETDPNGMLSPNNGQLSGDKKVGVFRVDSLSKHLLQCA